MFELLVVYLYTLKARLLLCVLICFIYYKNNTSLKESLEDKF